MSKRTVFKTYEFALVIVRNFDGKWLAVNESRGRGWWVPGGGVDKGETFMEAAIRETKEEAGIDVKLKGVLRVEHSPVGDNVRMRVIFFAEPKDHKQVPKSIPDEESIEAKWLTLEEIKMLDFQKPGIRGPELVDFPAYIERGGLIYPLDCFTDEGANMPKQLPEVITFELNSSSLSEPQDEEEKEEEKSSLDPNSYQLLVAIETNNLAKVEMLLMQMDLSKINEPISTKQLSFLYKAIRAKCSMNIINLLLLSGSDPLIQTTGKRNAFHYAARDGRMDVLIAVILMLEREGKSEYIKYSLRQKDSEDKKSPLEYLDSLKNKEAGVRMKETLKKYL